jgi:hypothetical protein
VSVLFGPSGVIGEHHPPTEEVSPVSEQSPFAVLEESFALLCSGPSPLAIDGREVGPPMPCRRVVLTELRGVLLHPSTPYETRDRAMGVLVRRAQRLGGPWTVGLAGVLLPGLRAAVADLVRACPEAAADLEAEVLVELIEALGNFDSDSERTASRLLWRAAQRARRRTVREQAAASGRLSTAPPDEPHRPWGHPDVVLAEAVAGGVLSPFEAEMIGETRLGGVPVAVWSAEVGWKPGSVRKERSVAERRLVEWINAGKPTRESASDASFRGAGRSPVVDETEPAHVAPAGASREVSALVRRLPTTGAARPGIDRPTRRTA